jgi:hypothetical protein
MYDSKQGLVGLFRKRLEKDNPVDHKSLVILETRHCDIINFLLLLLVFLKIMLLIACFVKGTMHW